MTTDSLRSFGERLAELAAARGEALALVYIAADDRETRFSWAEMDAQVNRYARVLMEEGVTPRDVVAFGLRNSPAHLFTTLAIWRLGATTMGFDPNLPPETRDALLSRVEGKLCIQETPDPDCLDRATLEARAAAQSADPVPNVTSHPGKILMSGGSTGLPKLMADDQPYLRAPGKTWGDVAPALGFRTDQVQLTCAAMSHNAPLTWTQNGIFEGNTTILMERFDAAKVIAAVDRFKVGFLLTVPTMLVRILDLWPTANASFASLHALYHTAAPCPVWLKKAWMDILGPERVYEMYGSGENTGQTVITGPEWLEHVGSVGRGFETQIRIRDAQGALLGPDEVGEVFMRPDDLSGRSRYLGKDAPQPRADEDGFYSVGDAGWLDKDGYLYLSGRRDDVINTGGHKVHPERVEAALLRHPQINDAVCFGVEDRDWGQSVMALVSGPDALDLDEVRTFLRAHLEPGDIPKTLRQEAALPRDGFGKIRRKALQAQENAARALMEP
ncbi:AMP-binding protein (plasmid) [Thioclava sp. 'Guangxiensis']|uniref:AMP-binding protein n=1 Tax=Thioclava sp. 'Guangxiensis' TaxID=3149044 RepID=UPI0032C4057F